MIKNIDKVLKIVSPSLHKTIKKWYNKVKKVFHAKLSREEFISILTDDMGIKTGDIVFVHSSMRSLYTSFPKSDILQILLDIVGEKGTLIFPAWHFNTRAEDYIKTHDIVFDYHNSKSAMGALSEAARLHPKAVRSFHPTNSMVAIGNDAVEFMRISGDIIPFSTFSLFGKLRRFGGKIIGIGLTVQILTFVHHIEDHMLNAFPYKTRKNKLYPCVCIDKWGDTVTFHTLVASEMVAKRNVTRFFEKHIPLHICTRFKVKGMDFFKADARPLFDRMVNLSLKGVTIYD